MDFALAEQPRTVLDAHACIWIAMSVQTQVHPAKQENDKARRDQKVERYDRIWDERIKGLGVEILHVTKRFPICDNAGKAERNTKVVAWNKNIASFV